MARIRKQRHGDLGTDSDVKSVETAQELSIQERARTEPSIFGAGGFLMYLTQAGELVSPWWSRQRDRDLDAFWKRSPHLSGALGMLIAKVATVPVRVMPRDVSIAQHLRQADEFTVRLVEEAEFGEGWVTAISKGLLDYWACDNGIFFEIIGAGKPDGPIEGPAEGIAHLDSFRCIRTGNLDYPVVYHHPSGKYSKLHRTRIAFASDMPSSRVEMKGVGFCALSRAVDIAQNLVDIGVYKQEKLGSRPLRGILQARGISTQVVIDSLAIAEEVMNNQALSRYAKLPVVGNIPTDAGLDLISLSTLPDGFDEETSTRLGMFAIALAFGVPIRWLWPAATTGATKADAMYQHIAGLGGGIGKVLRILTNLLGGSEWGSLHMRGRFLPPHLRLVFDFQDDEQDRARAEIKDLRTKTRAQDVGSGVLSIRVAREHALEDGDISRAQFEAMELEDGRLPDGADVHSLFGSTDPVYLRLLDLGVEEPLAIDINDPFDMLIEIEAAVLDAQDTMVNSTNATERQKANRAIAALGKLKSLYQPLVQQEIGLEAQAEALQQEEPEELEAEAIPEAAEKVFDFGVSAGEVIGGELARGASGRFVSVAQLRQQLMEGMRARLSARRAGGKGTRAGAAASKKGENRGDVAEALGIDTSLVEGLQAMRSGQEADTGALVAMGLAQVNADGSVTMTSEGRSLLSAANAGDVDRAKEALAKAGEEPKAPRGAPKASPKESARQREAERQAGVAENRNRVAEQLAEDGAYLGDLHAFAEGGDLSGESSASLARLGLVEFDVDGEPRMTGEGRAVLKAADAGEAGMARDLISRSRERVESYLARADLMRTQVNAVQEMARRAETEALEAELELARLQASPRASRRQIDRMERRLTQLQERAKRTSEIAESASGRIQAYEARVGGESTRAYYEERRRERGKKAASEPEPAEVSEGDSVHVSERIAFPCPLPECDSQEADLYADHGGLLVCAKCQRTFDPQFWRTS